MIKLETGNRNQMRFFCIVQFVPKKQFTGLESYISTKMDGSSNFISIDEDGFHVTGHNYEYKDDGNSDFYKLVNERGYKKNPKPLWKKKDLLLSPYRESFALRAYSRTV